MRKKFTTILTLVILFFAILGITWISAYNGAIKKNNDIIESRSNVYASISARYEKVGAFIDAIEGANQTVLSYLNTIKEARTAFANAINNNKFDTADEAMDTIDATFITLISYMEDNPSSYNTVNLYSGFMSEFSASTNVVIEAIREYNSKVTSYNNHIRTFPNNLFLKGRTTYLPYETENYNTDLPTFNK